MSWLVISWRNLWRNRRRTFVTLATIAASTAVLVLFQSLMVGMFIGTVANLTDVQVGQVQVHGDGYRKRPSMYRDVQGAQAILDWADAQGVHAAPRSFGAGLIGAGEKSAGAEIWGVNPERERRAFKLASSLVEGDFVDEGDPSGVVIGQKLARSIDAGVGDELVVVVAAADGSMGNELWRVRGILAAMGDRIDRTAVIAPAATFDEIFVANGRVHQIALSTRPGPVENLPAGRGTIDEQTLTALVRRVAPEGDEVLSWRGLNPTMSDMVDLSDRYLAVFAFIFFTAAALGILNTMLMAAYERIPEMGLVKALGASPWRVFGEMSIEVVILSALGALIGMMIGGAAALYLSANGIDTTSFGGQIEMNGVVWDPVWRADFDLGRILRTPLSLIPVALVAGLYPAIHAARVVPVEALRRIS